jgi:hypothetical protein
VRLARAGCGNVDYWMGLPILEVLEWMLEVSEQMKAENDAMKVR